MNTDISRKDVEGARTKSNCTCLWDEQLMVAAEYDHGLFQRAQRDGSGSPVPNHFIRQQAQLVGDPLWKVEPVQRVAHGR